jgi:Tfp pilus assembly major pilin PilA
MKNMLKNQQGMTFIGMVIVIAAIICLALIGMKVAPPYAEYMNVKKAVKKAASEGAGSKKEVADAFNRQASIDNITVIKGADLQVNGEDVSAEYQVVVPLVANASVLLDFNATSK